MVFIILQFFFLCVFVCIGLVWFMYFFFSNIFPTWAQIQQLSGYIVLQINMKAQVIYSPALSLKKWLMQVLRKFFYSYIFVILLSLLFFQFASGFWAQIQQLYGCTVLQNFTYGIFVKKLVSQKKNNWKFLEKMLISLSFLWTFVVLCGFSILPCFRHILSSFLDLTFHIKNLI